MAMSYSAYRCVNRFDKLKQSHIIESGKQPDIQNTGEEAPANVSENASKNVEKSSENSLTTGPDPVEVVVGYDPVTKSEENKPVDKNLGGKENTTFNQDNVHYEGDIAIYTDRTSGYQYQWSKEKNEWEHRKAIEYGFEDDTHVYTDAEGAKYFWDKGKNAWFPKIDDDFMARYQMSYGFSQTTSDQKAPQESVPAALPQQNPSQKAKGEKRKASEPTWFEVNEDENTKVYVSNLPTDITEEEFVDFMQKCGLVMRDTATSKFKVKLYKESGSDILKGDALCTYIRVESVDLALKILDGSDFKGKKVKVEKAMFQMKGEYDPKLKPKMKKKKDKLKLKRQQEKLFDWRPEKVLGERAKHEKTVIIKNLFDPAMFDTDVSLILEFQQDLREECSKVGEVRKVTLYDRHPEGVAQVNMSTPEEADEVIKLLNGRWFMKRQLTAETWDGRTKYRIAETDSQISQRLEGWDKFLEADANKKGSNTDESNCKATDSENKG